MGAGCCAFVALVAILIADKGGEVGCDGASLSRTPRYVLLQLNV